MECMEEIQDGASACNQTLTADNVRILKKYHDKAFRLISEGLSHEEHGEILQAMDCYRKGLVSLEAGLHLPGGITMCAAEDKPAYAKMARKMKSAKENVIYRLELLSPTSSSARSKPSDPPASASDESSSSSVRVIPPRPTPPQTRNARLIEPQRNNSEVEDNSWEDVSELLSIKEGVNLFHVDRTGQVSTWSEPCQLEIFQLLKEHAGKLSPPAFLKCGEWIYPLVTGESPVLKSSHRTYMFPGITLSTEGPSEEMSSIGLVLSEIVPHSAVARFERILKLYCDFRDAVSLESKTANSRTRSRSQPTIECSTPPSRLQVAVDDAELIVAEPGVVEEETSHWSDKVVNGIHVGTQWISWGLVKGAEYTSQLVEKGAGKLREHIRPNEEAANVDPTVSRNIRQLHEATGAALQISSFLVSALTTLTMNLGRQLAPHVIRHGKKLLPDKLKLESNAENQKTSEDLRRVAAAGLQGFSMVFFSLEQAGKDLGRGISRATVDTVSHKYGSEAGGVTEDAIGAAGNTLQAYWNVKKLGVKAIAKSTAKETGRAILEREENAVERDMRK